MATRKKKSRRPARAITLRDVVVHMEHMEQRLSSAIKKVDGQLSTVEQSLSAKIEKNSADIRSNTIAIKDLETKLTQRIDALEEDLTATMKDTLTIRRHVGMAVPNGD